MLCFPWPITWAVDASVPDGGACPADDGEVVAIFEAEGCPRGFEPSAVVSGPLSTTPDQCCYMTDLVVCGPGGRPFLAGDGARLASVERGGGAEGWGDGASPGLDGLTAGERASLAEAWTEAGLFEHASVASFARVSLELLAVGAPGDLVELAHRAALDEIVHARLCFALASAYAGESVAPGAFPLGAEVCVGASLAEVAASTFAEGCVGETVAAVVAAEQLARATDPAVREALARIAADEARHAELAWRTVAWALREGGRDVRAAVERVVTMGGPRPPQPPRPSQTPPSEASRALPGHGLLDAATLAQVVAAAMADVVAPCARALLDGGEGLSAPAGGLLDART